MWLKLYCGQPNTAQRVYVVQEICIHPQWPISIVGRIASISNVELPEVECLSRWPSEQEINAEVRFIEDDSETSKASRVARNRIGNVDQLVKASIQWRKFRRVCDVDQSR